MHDVATEQSPTDPPVESPRFTVAPAVAALPDDQAQAVWEQSEYVVSWGTQEGHEIVWLQRDGKLPLVSWSAEEALDTLNFILSLDYDDSVNLAFPYAPAITQNDLIAFVLGLRSGLRSLATLEIP